MTGESSRLQQQSEAEATLFGPTTRALTTRSERLREYDAFNSPTSPAWTQKALTTLTWTLAVPRNGKNISKASMTSRSTRWASTVLAPSRRTLEFEMQNRVSAADILGQAHVTSGRSALASNRTDARSPRSTSFIPDSGRLSRESPRRADGSPMLRPDRPIEEPRCRSRVASWASASFSALLRKTAA